MVSRRMDEDRYTMGNRVREQLLGRTGQAKVPSPSHKSSWYPTPGTVISLPLAPRTLRRRRSDRTYR
jgi:hypothetical protein